MTDKAAPISTEGIRWRLRFPRGVRRDHGLVESHAGVVAPAPPSTPEPEVGFVSLSGHGSKDIMVVRAQVRVNNGPPPDDRTIRYVDLMRRTDGRWMVFAESVSGNAKLPTCGK